MNKEVNTLSFFEPSESLWQQIGVQIAQLAVVNAAAPALEASVPIAGPIAAGLLVQLTKGTPEELKQLKQIRADTQALLEGPYNTAKEWLNESHNIVDPEEKKEAVENALDSFMEAHGLAQHPYRKALTQHHIGTCWVLLGSNENARRWYQRAYASALEYLRNEGNQLHDTWNTYMKYEKYKYSATEHWRIADYSATEYLQDLQGMAERQLSSDILRRIQPLGKGLQSLGKGLGLVGSATTRAFSIPLEAVVDRAQSSYNQAKEEFRNDYRPVLDFIEALENLQKESAALMLRFQGTSPTSASFEVWLRNWE